jgi:hypothetical protein
MFVQSPALTRPRDESAISRAGSVRHRVVVVGRGPAADRLMRDLSGGPVEIVRLERLEPKLPYDTLVVATGTEIRFAGADAWQEFAGADDLNLEERVRMAHEFANSELDEAERARLLTFVVVGAGPAEVELALALAQRTREIIGEGAHLVLAAPALLPGAPRRGRERQARALADWGVELRLGSVEPTARGVVVDGERIDAGTVAWAAGITPAEAARCLGASPPQSMHVIANAREGARLAAALLRELGARAPNPFLRLERAARNVLARFHSRRPALS